MFKNMNIFFSDTDSTTREKGHSGTNQAWWTLLNLVGVITWRLRFPCSEKIRNKQVSSPSYVQKFVVSCFFFFFKNSHNFIDKCQKWLSTTTDLLFSKVRFNTLILCIAPEILKWQSVFLYNLGRLNDFIGQKCLKLKLRFTFIPTWSWIFIEM